MADDPEGLLRRMMSTLQDYFGETDDASEPDDTSEADDAETDPSAPSDTQDSDTDMPDDDHESDEATDTPDSDDEPEDETGEDEPEEEHAPGEPEDSGDEDTDDAAEDGPTVEERLDELEERLESKQNELEAERKKRKAAERKADRVDDLSEAEQQVRRREIQDTVQDAAENGRIHAKHVPLWCELLELAEDAEEALDRAVIDFSDADVGSDDAQTLRKTLEYIMNNQGPVVALGELDEFEEDVEPVNLSDVDSIQQAAKREQQRAEEEEGEAITFSEAVSRIQRRTETA